MPARALLQPRKTPVQARSTASVDAMLEATVQVLLTVGKERLTTARVAQRAGVSVGTLYQYFPNKSSLLQQALKRHVDGVAVTLKRVCREQQGRTLREMATALANAYLEAKMGDRTAGVVLYAVSSDVDGASVARAAMEEIHDVIVAMLCTAREPLGKDPALVATVMQSAMTGVSRRLLELPSPEAQLEAFREELVALLCGYLATCAVDG